MLGALLLHSQYFELKHLLAMLRGLHLALVDTLDSRTVAQLRGHKLTTISLLRKFHAALGQAHYRYLPKHGVLNVVKID